MTQDDYWYDRVKRCAQNSNCHSRQIGAVLVSSNNQLISGGWNSSMLPDECKDFCPRQELGFKSGEGLEICPAIHAEIACIAAAAREEKSTYNSRLYMNSCFPCKNCAVALIASGISEIICLIDDYYDEISKLIYKKYNINLRTFNLTKEV